LIALLKRFIRQISDGNTKFLFTVVGNRNPKTMDVILWMYSYEDNGQKVEAFTFPNLDWAIRFVDYHNRKERKSVASN
jgi:hypothetical protein